MSLCTHSSDKAPYIAVALDFFAFLLIFYILHSRFLGNIVIVLWINVVVVHVDVIAHCVWVGERKKRISDKW